MILARGVTAALHGAASHCRQVHGVPVAMGRGAWHAQAHAGQARSYAQSTQVQAAHEPADYEQANYEEGSEHQEAPGRVQWVPREEFSNYRKNAFVCIGRLGRDFQVVQTRIGKAVAKTTLAINPSQGSEAEGEKTLWIKLELWDDDTGVVGRAVTAFKKGKLIAADGKLRRNEYTDREGKQRSEFVLTAQSLADVVEGSRHYDEQQYE